ncbi:MAG: hypothetical protein HQM08_04355 [Candidatus Riflebacteria bacterium]|nr:hypothetical protein [Candidatus Riflebacteria bacterium]
MSENVQTIKILESLAGLWQDLLKANTDFLSGNRSQEAIKTLLAIREFSFEQTSKLESDLIERFRSEFPELTCETPNGVWKRIREQPGIIGQIFQKSKETLTSLIKSDSEVQEYFAESRVNLKNQIKGTHKSSRLLRGYSQASPLGSCFIDKVK